MNVVGYSDIESEVDLKSELIKAVSISVVKPNSGQSSKISSLLKKEIKLSEAKWTLTSNLEVFFKILLTVGPVVSNAKWKFSVSGIWFIRPTNALCTSKFHC